MLTIIIKGTNGCNLACSYCSLGEKKNFKFVDKQKLKEIFIYAGNYARYKNEKTITFILHGGEPTMVPIYVYREAIDEMKKEFTDLKIIICMQTNGFQISDEFIEFAQTYEIKMGISIDGSEEIHDSERRTYNGKPSYLRVTTNIDRMINAGLGVSCLMVLTKNGCRHGYEYLKFFSDRNIHLKINPLLNYGEVYDHPELTLEPGDYARYLIKMYEYIIENNIEVNISPTDKILTAILKKQSIRECSFDSECSKYFLCIDYKGDIYPCGKFSDMEKYKIGNIDGTKYEYITEYITNHLIKRRNELKPDKCKKCKYIRLCNSGCSAEALIDGDFLNTPILCEDYKMIFKYFYHDGLILLKKELEKIKENMEVH